ncbi:MAG: (2Fe-2S)-binding protein [Chloroflexi bacterium UTCFX4]|jgi:carbon-monoxide dehydrogenase small subunit|nr:MAG: (2Fe-2S)-binding protein [Chloroflexi bacterium UTCFX4]
MKQVLHLRVNGQAHELYVEPHKTLLEVLREELDLTGTKHGCDLGECGACTVLVDGTPILACLALPIELQEREITTVEGLAHGAELHPLQRAFAELNAAQCGYCTSGMMLSAKALLDRETNPTREKIRDALAGNLCRCTGYEKILEAVEVAGREVAGRK